MIDHVFSNAFDFYFVKIVLLLVEGIANEESMEGAVETCEFL